MTANRPIISCQLTGDVGDYKLVVCMDRQPFYEIGPCETKSERARLCALVDYPNAPRRPTH